MFNFKQFSVEDDKSSMKVGTDAVLVGTLANSKCPRKILDIGTGSGVISLILAQRYPKAKLTAIDIDLDSVMQANDNFRRSPYGDRIIALNRDARIFSENEEERATYDLIVSNPPFFQNSLKAPNPKRTMARHNDALPFETLADSVERLLSNEGHFVAILPCPEAAVFISIATSKHLFCKSQTIISNRPSTKPIRNIFTLVKAPIAETTIDYYSIRNEDNTYSAWYRGLTDDFYTSLK